MSTTVINDWCFVEGFDRAEAMRAVEEYMTYLRTEDTGLAQSLWLTDRDNRLRHFHIATYGSLEALDRQRTSSGTMRFVERIGGMIAPDTFAQPVGDVIANAGTGPGEVSP